MFYNFFSFFIVFIPIMLMVAFLTLYERKILAVIQYRVGPNKPSIMGVFTPLCDAVKLFSKQAVITYYSNFLLMCSSGVLLFFIVSLMLIYLPFNNNVMSVKYSIFLWVVVLSFEIFPIFLMGWGSSSKFSLMGSMRGIIQVISFEMLFMLMIFTIVSYNKSMNLSMLMMNSNYLMYTSHFFIMYIFFIMMLIDSSRVPFDFIEGESELVSGFNIEYSGGLFALIFMSEYAKLIILMYLYYMCFFPLQLIFSNTCMLLLLFLVIWVRGTFPRYRYDMMMYFSWNSVLPGLCLYYMYVLMAM